jgi:hypothetical protein
MRERGLSEKDGEYGERRKLGAETPQGPLRRKRGACTALMLAAEILAKPEHNVAAYKNLYVYLVWLKHFV